MHQQRFVDHYRGEWQELETILEGVERSRHRRGQGDPAAARLPHLYRQVCNHYAIAQQRRYSPTLVEQLHRLVLRGHQQLYTRHSAWRWRLLMFVLADFPRTLRRELRSFLLALALFLLPALAVGGLCLVDETLAYSVLGDEGVSELESMYDPANKKIGREEGRSAESDFTMFGFYIYNNIGIGFRAFALGILAGAGTLFTLLFNGLFLGAAAGHLTRIGYGVTFWPFVCGHGALELTAIVICGAAGLILGHAVLAPGQYRRSEAIKRRGRPALALVMGAALMLLGAAFIEAFWSSSGFGSDIKYGVALLLWSGVIGYFTLAGRGADGAR